jgi:hypothetical protein
LIELLLTEGAINENLYVLNAVGITFALTGRRQPLHLKRTLWGVPVQRDC